MAVTASVCCGGPCGLVELPVGDQSVRTEQNGPAIIIFALVGTQVVCRVYLSHCGGLAPVGIKFEGRALGDIPSRQIDGQDDRKTIIPIALVGTQIVRTIHLYQRGLFALDGIKFKG